VAEPVQEFLLRRLPRTPWALREAASMLDRLALAAGGRITRALAANVIEALSDSDDATEANFTTTSRFDEDSGRLPIDTSPDGPGFL
jgi:hypothetical protein